MFSSLSSNIPQCSSQNFFFIDSKLGSSKTSSNAPTIKSNSLSSDVLESPPSSQNTDDNSNNNNSNNNSNSSSNSNSNNNSNCYSK